MTYIGATRILPRLPVPASSRVTNTAPTTLLARAGFTPRERATVYGVLPAEMVEGFEPERAYDVKPIEGLGRAPDRGLGQTDEQVIGARDILLRMINTAISELKPYGPTEAVKIRSELSKAEQWFKGGIERFYGGNNADALRSFTNGITIMHRVISSISVLSPPMQKSAEALARTQAGASFPTQVSRTIEEVTGSISEPIATALESISPATAEAVRSAGWLLPVGAGLALFLLLRR